jgi:hypothetical protein
MHPRRCIEVHFKMKKLLIFALVAAIPAAAQWRRFGQEEVRPTGWLGLGAATPINPLATRLDTGWSISGGAGITSKYVGIMLDANYTDFGINREELRRIGAPRGSQKYWSITVDPVFHVNQRGPVDFYVTGGAGLYSQVTQSPIRRRFRRRRPALLERRLQTRRQRRRRFRFQRRRPPQSHEDLHGSAIPSHVHRAIRRELHSRDGRRPLLSAVHFSQRGGGSRAVTTLATAKKNRLGHAHESGAPRRDAKPLIQARSLRRSPTATSPAPVSAIVHGSGTELSLPLSAATSPAVSAPV